MFSVKNYDGKFQPCDSIKPPKRDYTAAVIVIEYEPIPVSFENCPKILKKYI